MKILFLTDNFPPETNAPASRTFEHASQWVNDGHEVTVVTCAPNFPTGKLFAGYQNRWYQKEMMSGIKVIRVKTYITANEGFMKRILDYLSFMLTGTVASLFQKRPDIVVATSPQFFTAVAGYLISRMRRRPFVFELRDLWPASITAVSAMEHGRMIRYLERLEQFLYCKADLIVSVTESFKRELIDRDIPADKIVVIRNGVDLKKFHPMLKNQALLNEFDLQGKFVVGYIGTHGMAHGLPKIIEAASQMQNDTGVVFMFVGDGSKKEALEKTVRLKNLSNVRLIPMQPKSRMPELWSICDIALIPLRNQILFRSVIPSKLFESMGMGIPVIMSVPEGEATSIVLETGCGIVVPPEDPDALCANITQLRHDDEKLRLMKEQALTAVSGYSREKSAKLMLQHFQSTIEKHRITTQKSS